MTEEINLRLHLSENNELLFNVALFDKESTDNGARIYKLEKGYDGYTLLDIMKDVFFVTKLECIYNEDIEKIGTKSKELEELEERDNYWNYFINLLIWLYEVCFSRHKNIIDERNSTEADAEDLKDKKLRQYSSKVSEMGEPFITRYKIYRILSLLYKKSLLRTKFNGCTKIVCNGIEFSKFWTDSITHLSDLCLSIQVDDIQDLKIQLLTLINSVKYQKKFKKEYIDKRCFSMTKVQDVNGHIQDVLCFSGIKSHNGNDYLSLAIQEIVNSNYFHNPYHVQVCDDIRYYLPDGKYVTFGEVRNLYHEFDHRILRMFSCCERKTFADYDWSNCSSYKMYIKIHPCELCDSPVTKHKNKYNGNIICGTAIQNPLNNKDKMDEIARVVYDANHPD